MTTREAEVIDKVAEDYRNRGYRVDVRPTGAAVPEFLGEYQPHLIARGPGDSVVVEVKTGSRTSVADRLRHIAERVNRQPGWRFSLVYVNPRQPEWISDATLLAVSEIQHRAEQARDLLEIGQADAAFLLLWTAAEAALRVLAQRADLPLETLPTLALIREMYSAGEIGLAHFEHLMRLLPIRNRLVHGLGAGYDTRDLNDLRVVVELLLSEARSPAS